MRKNKIDLDLSKSMFLNGINDKDIDCPNFYVSGTDNKGHPIISKSYSGVPEKSLSYKQLRKEIFAKRGF